MGVFYRSLLLLLHLTSFSLHGKIRPVSLTCEYKTNPVGIEASHPRFGWWIETAKRHIIQTAYQIQVSTSNEKLFRGEADVWDSGKVMSDKNSLIAYSGSQLKSAKKYFWRIRVWDKSGKASPWSKFAEFSTGILFPGEWDMAYWIACEVLPDSSKITPAIHGRGDGLGKRMVNRAVNPYFRKSFSVQKTVANALVFVSGLGQYELHLNGEKVSDDFLTPGWTDYSKRCAYNTYNVTKQLQQGENVLGSVLGTGFFYINRERYRKIVGAYGFPMLRLILRIQYTDGTTEQIVTDESWKVSPSPIIYTSIYGGEDYDARHEQTGWNQKGFNDIKWKSALRTTGPGGKMTSQIEYPLRVMDTIAVKKITSPATNRHIYDFGQNASGIIALKVRGKRGDTIRVTPSELLDGNGLITQKSSGSPFYFEYVLKGEGIEEWVPRFSYYGFRYAMVEGGVPEKDDTQSATRIVSLNFLHTRNAAPAAGSFSCSNPLFNKIYQLIDWSLKSNIASVSTDCPHREKMGWLEQAHLMGESLKYNYDIFHLYNKIVDDVIEAQLPNGMVPSIVPEYVEFDGPFRDDPGYGSAAVILPWYLYKWYGDRQVLIRSYDMMKRYLWYLNSRAESNILSYGLGDWLDTGPNDPGISQLTPVALTATAFYYQNVVLMAKIAGILERTDDERKYGALALEVKKSFNEKFFNPVTKVYGSGSQTSYSMPLYMGLVAEEEDRKDLFANLRDSILRDNKRITAGDIGHRFLVKTLEEEGASELLFEMNNNTELPGYGYQIKHGATALAEHWSGPSIDWLSQNHMIFGHLMEWFYSGLSGIRQQEGDSGFKRLIIDPHIAGDISWVKSSYKSTNGLIRVEWERTENKFVLNVDIPANSETDIVLRGTTPQKVIVNGKSVSNNKGIKSVKVDDGKLFVTIPSGRYRFVCSL